MALKVYAIDWRGDGRHRAVAATSQVKAAELLRCGVSDLRNYGHTVEPAHPLHALAMENVGRVVEEGKS